MKKILIRIESHSKSGVGGMESRIFEFCKILKHDFTFLTNSKYIIKSSFFGNYKYIFSNYFGFFGILKDIFSFRNFEIIESNGLRDNIISSINFLLFFPFYKIKKTKLFLVIHGNIGIIEMNGKQKIIYNFIFKIGLLICDKIIVVSEELKDFLIKNYKISDKKIEIILNFIKINNNFGENNLKKALLVSRIDKQKLGGIIKTIDFCLKNNILIHIYGDGDFLPILRQNYKNNNFIKILGFEKQENINYKNYSFVFAMGRALLEGISNGLNGFLVGYDDLICEINLKNYEKIKYSNFSGRGILKQKINIENTEKNKKEIFKKIKNEFSLENLRDFYK